MKWLFWLKPLDRSTSVACTLVSKIKLLFILYCSSLFVSLASPKILSLDNAKQKNHFLFCIVLVYSYLCRAEGVALRNSSSNILIIGFVFNNLYLIEKNNIYAKALFKETAC